MNDNNNEIYRVSKDFMKKEEQKELDTFDVSKALNDIKSKVTNEFKVSQFTLDNLTMDNRLNIERITSESIKDKASIFNKRIEEEPADFWSEESTNKANPLQDIFLNLFSDAVDELDIDSNNSKYLDNVVYIIRNIEAAPNIIEYIKDNKLSLCNYIHEQYDAIGDKLFNKLLKNLEN